jgi:hypothetical protein
MVVDNKIIVSVLVVLDTDNFMTGMTYVESRVDNRRGNLENNTFADIMIPGSNYYWLTVVFGLSPNVKEF